MYKCMLYSKLHWPKHALNTAKCMNRSQMKARNRKAEDVGCKGQEGSCVDKKTQPSTF